MTAKGGEREHITNMRGCISSLEAGVARLATFKANHAWSKAMSNTLILQPSPVMPWMPDTCLQMCGFVNVTCFGSESICLPVSHGSKQPGHTKHDVKCKPVLNKLIPRLPPPPLTWLSDTWFQLRDLDLGEQGIFFWTRSKESGHILHQTNKRKRKEKRKKKKERRRKKREERRMSKHLRGKNQSMTERE